MDDKQAALNAFSGCAPDDPEVLHVGGDMARLNGSFEAATLRKIADVLDPPQPDPRLDEAIALAKRQAERIQALERRLAEAQRRGPPVGYVHDDGYRYMPTEVFEAWSERCATPEIAAEWSPVGRVAV